MAAETFIDDDAGFLHWRDSHPGGFVVNADRRPVAAYVRLHRASCGHLHRPVAEGRWTKDYIKICSEQVDDLIRWAEDNVPGYRGLNPCKGCRP